MRAKSVKNLRSKRSGKPTRSIRLKPSPRAKKSVRVARSAQFAWGTNPAAIAVAVICVGAVMLVASPRSRTPADIEQSRQLAAPAQAETPRAAATNAAPFTADGETRVTDAPMANWPVMESVDAQTASVTITGCVDHDDDRFRLKNTAGANAPKARSWKSGFLKKGPAPIELVDADNTLKLPTYVGHRVAATGTLVNRELQVQSMRWVSNASCS